MIRFTCPTCNRTLRAPDRQGGRPGACPSCRQQFLIPAQESMADYGYRPPDMVPACEHCGARVAGVAVSRVSVFGYLVCFALAALILLTTFLMGVFFPLCFVMVVALPVSLAGLLIRTARWECPACGRRR